MRRVFQIAAVLLAVAMMATGCDFFRTLAGRPTSKDIEAKRAEILRSAQDDKGAQDDKVAQDDSEAVLERRDDGQRPYSAAAGQSEARTDAAVSDQPAGSTVAQGITEEKPGNAAKKVEKKRYYVILGAFSNKENAERYADKIRSYGYEPEFFGFTEGRTAVGIGGTDDPEEAQSFMRKLKGQDFCPEGVWILDRKR